MFVPVNVVVFFVVCFMLVAGCNAATVEVDWSNVTHVSNTYTTLQVVINPLYERSSPIHNSTFKALADLELEYVRFQGWYPYPLLVVAELHPPTGNPVCASIAAGQTLYLSCNEGVFESIDFASFGTPNGRCEAFAQGSCHSNVSVQVLEKYCLGKTSCSVNTSSAIFVPDGNCSKVPIRLAVQATCSISVNKTFWDFSLLDPFVEDFMDAQQNRSMILNFCTSPEWLWNTGGPVGVPTDPNGVDWNYNVGTDLRDNSFQDLTAYYTRLFQWYTAGGFTDEYGAYHNSGHYYFIPFFEVFNEMDLSGHSVESYTAMYDAIATAIKQISPKTQMVGLALGSAITHFSWFEYFLDPSNHAPDAPPLEWISYHHYAIPASRNNTQGYETFFENVDTLLATITQIEAVRKKFSPQVKTTIDEVGVILPQDNVLVPAPIPDIYWNAAGAMYAYMYANIIKQGIEVLGESQLIGYPTQYPSVSMIDWTNGKPNARYWVLYLLKNFFQVGDQLVVTSSSNNTAIYAQGFITAKGKAILIINKLDQMESVTVDGMQAGELTFVDLSTFEGPPVSVSLANSTFTLNPFAVAVISL